MQSKTSLILPVCIGIIAGIAFSLMIIFFLHLDLPGLDSYAKLSSPTISRAAQNDDNPTEPALSTARPEETSVGLPVRLKIPGINVDSDVEHVGLDSRGAMETPKIQGDVAWYESGWRPGENGSAVIAGHYGWENNKPSVFDNLYKLRKGDKLFVEDDQGTVIAFVVRESRRYVPDADTSHVFSSNDGKPHLNLITCEGDWNKDSQSYSKRLVVFADKE